MLCSLAHSSRIRKSPPAAFSTSVKRVSSDPFLLVGLVGHGISRLLPVARSAKMFVKSGGGLHGSSTLCISPAVPDR